MTFALTNLTNLTNIATVAAVVGATFSPVAGGRTQTRVWVKGYGYTGRDAFESAEERATECLRLREEAERMEEVLQALSSRA